MSVRHAIVPALALFVGCAPDREPGRTARTPAWQARAEADDPVVARVDGIAIHASAVARQARLARTSARAALDELVRMELLAAEALRLGHDADADVREEARRAIVRRFLEATFERDFTKEDIPESELKARYQKNLHRFVHPELRRVVHALVPVQSDATTQRREQAQKRAEAVHRAVTAGDFDAAGFRSAAQGLSDAGLQVRVEELVTPRHGYTEEGFARAAFAVRGPGRISDVVATSFGYHVIYLISIDPQQNRSYPEARAQVLEEAWPELRAQAFLRFCDDLAGRHQAIVNDAPLRGGSGG